MISSTLRQWHTYIGLFIAPSVLFFAMTGIVQIFSLHEAHGGYHPPALLEKLSAVHKDQIFEAKREQPAADDAAQTAPNAGDQAADDEDRERTVPTYVLKWFFTIVALGLTASTLIGIWMGTTQTRRRGLAWSLLVVGALVPLGLLLI